MTNLKSIEYYLREYNLVKVRIDTLKSELDELLAIIGNVNNAVNSTNEDKADRLSAAAERLSSELLGEIAKITDRYNKVGVMIGNMENPEMKAVFVCRYIGQMAFWKIEKKLGMSETKAKNLHRSGLEILKERYG